MADFAPAIKKTLQNEGGLVNNPADPGGLTMMGITFSFFQKSYQFAEIQQPTADALIHLTEAQAIAIYKATFWDGIMGDQIQDQAFAEQLFDSHVNFDELIGVNSGVAIQILQNLLVVRGAKIVADSVFGKATLDALNVAPQLELYDAYLQARIGYYQYLPTVNPALSQFLDGWIYRANLYRRK